MVNMLKNLHGDIREAIYLKVCCFSGTDENILMWSHYANYHKGICLRFKSIKNWHNKEKDEYYLEFDYLNPDDAQSLARFNPDNNLFYEVLFIEVKYTDDIPESLNMFDEDKNIRLGGFLLNKFSVWNYENEYRMILDEYDDAMLLSKDEFKQGLVKYQKEDLEGIVFGLKIDHNSAKLVYETVKKNYLDKVIAVNF